MQRQVLIAIGVLIVGAIVIFFAKPPSTICDVQLEIIKKNLRTVYTSTRSKAFAMPPELQVHVEKCVQENFAGACFEYFQDLHRVLHEVAQYPVECRDQTDDLAFLQKTLQNGMTVLARIWQSSENWLEPADLRLFCDMKNNLAEVFGPDSATSVVNAINHEDQVRQNDPTKKAPSGRASPRPLTQLDCRQYR